MPQQAFKKPGMLNEVALWLIDEQDAHSKVISSLISDRFALSCKVSTLSSVENKQLNSSYKHYFLINCKAYSAIQIRELLSRFHSYNDSVKVALIGVVYNQGFEEFIQWPQIVGMFVDGCSAGHLEKGIREIVDGGHWLPRHLISEILRRNRKTPGVVKKSDKLTRREVQILEHLNKGLTNHEIGELVHVSGHTVRTHLYNVYKKIGVKNRTQACNWLKQNCS